MKLLKAMPQQLCQAGRQITAQGRELQMLLEELETSGRALSRLSQVDDILEAIRVLRRRLAGQAEAMNRMGQVLEEAGRQYRACENRNLERAEEIPLLYWKMPGVFFNLKEDVLPDVHLTMGGE